jgi:hypothetical protein
VLGDVSLNQKENTVTGELRFSNGIVANLHGTIVNRDYTFDWGIHGQQLGTGNLKLTSDGKTLNGSYVDNRVGTPIR